MNALARYQIILLGEQRHIHWCEQLAQGCCPTMHRPGIEPRGHGSGLAGRGWSRSNRAPVALCTLGLGLLNSPSLNGR